MAKGGRSGGYTGLTDLLDGGGPGASRGDAQKQQAFQPVNSVWTPPQQSQPQPQPQPPMTPQPQPMAPSMAPQASARPMPRPSMPGGGPAAYEQQRAPAMPGGPAIYEQQRAPQPMAAAQTQQPNPEAIADWAIQRYGPTMVERAADDPAVLQSLMKAYLESAGTN